MFAEKLYRYRWPLSGLVLAATIAALAMGFGRLGSFSQQVESLGDGLPNPDGTQPRVFDARYDIRFHPEDPALQGDPRTLRARVSPASF